MSRVKEIIMFAFAMSVGVTVSPAAQPITNQRVTIEDVSSFRAAPRQNPTLLDQLESHDNVEVEGARHRLTDML